VSIVVTVPIEVGWLSASMAQGPRTRSSSGALGRTSPDAGVDMPPLRRSHSAADIATVGTGPGP
jgi:hypothetical protein